MKRWGFAAALTVVAVMSTPPTVTAAGPAATQPAPRDDVLVMFTGYGQLPLSERCKALVLAEAERLKPERQNVWFIMIEASDRFEVWASVCYTPSHTSPRLRKGEFADVHVGMGNVQPGGKDVVTSSRIDEYVQVARGDERFTEKDGRPPATIPDTQDLPFRRPYYKRRQLERGEWRGEDPLVPMPDALVVRLTDFARKVFDDRGVSDPVCTVRVIGRNRFLLAAGIEDWGGHFFEAVESDGKLSNAQKGLTMWADSLNASYSPDGRPQNSQEEEYDLPPEGEPQP